MVACLSSQSEPETQTLNKLRDRQEKKSAAILLAQTEVTEYPPPYRSVLMYSKVFSSSNK